MLYEDVVVGGPRTSQYSPSVGEGHFLIYHLLVMKQAYYLPLQLMLFLTAFFNCETASIVDCLRLKPYWLGAKIRFASTHVRKRWYMIPVNNLYMQHNKLMPL